MNAKASTAQTTDIRFDVPRDEWMVQDYMAKGFDRETAEALAILNNCGQHKIGG